MKKDYQWMEDRYITLVELSQPSIVTGQPKITSAELKEIKTLEKKLGYVR